MPTRKSSRRDWFVLRTQISRIHAEECKAPKGKFRVVRRYPHSYRIGRWNELRVVGDYPTVKEAYSHMWDELNDYIGLGGSGNIRWRSHIFNDKGEVIVKETHVP